MIWVIAEAIKRWIERVGRGVWGQIGEIAVMNIAYICHGYAPACTEVSVYIRLTTATSSPPHSQHNAVSVPVAALLRRLLGEHLRQGRAEG